MEFENKTHQTKASGGCLLFSIEILQESGGSEHCLIKSGGGEFFPPTSGCGETSVLRETQPERL